jgi:hypothetical protein
MRFQFIQALWGKQYVDHFLNVALPSCMTTGNLLGFSRDEAELDIYTTPEDVQTIQAAPIIGALSLFIDVRMTTLNVSRLPSKTEVQKFTLMTEMQRFAMDRSDATDSAMFMLAPDGVFADGTFARSRELLQSGKRLVMIGTMRVSRAGFLEEFQRRFNPHNRIGARITPRELMDISLRHPHESCSHLEWGNAEQVDWPSHLVFPVDDEGFVLRAFHMHPIAIYPKERGVRPAISIDDSTLTRIVPDRADWHILQDSDEGFGVDFGTPPEEARPRRAYPDPLMHVASWARAHSGPHQWWMAGHPVVMHRTALSPKWQEQLDRSARVVSDVLQRIPSAPPWPG